MRDIVYNPMDQRIDDQIGPQREEQTKVYKTWSGFQQLDQSSSKAGGCFNLLYFKYFLVFFWRRGQTATEQKLRKNIAA
ncbi:hypothetical protein KEM48_010808 [Puccinia striiformis f. sp. tritici PST-130]|nr:hypothetical protein KEM48_010808 [Puccinia striiformis f. sp. tritici PST-130]